MDVTHAQVDDHPEVERHMRRIIDSDLSGYDPRIHSDVDDLQVAYFGRDDRVLLLVRDPRDGSVAGTVSVRQGGPDSAYVPEWLSARYSAVQLGQICRVWVAPHARRLGVGRTLATAAAEWAAQRYDLVCLHTDDAIPGALAFWRTFPGLEQVYDGRADDSPGRIVHFELHS